MKKGLRLGFRHKKAFVVLDIILVIVILFVFGFVALIAYNFLKDVNTDMQADSSLNENAKGTIGTLSNNYPSLFDKLFITAMALFWGMLLLTVYFIESHPSFMIFTLILLVFVLFIGAILANAFAEFGNDVENSSSYQQFPMTKYVMEHLFIFILLIGISVLVVLYGKSQT